MSFFDDSHVTEVGLQGSAGPAVGFTDMISQSYRQQYRVDSARALDEELRNRWLESLRGLGGQFSEPINPQTYRAFAGFTRGQPIEGFSTGTEGEGYGAKFVDIDPLEHPDIQAMLKANEAIKKLNNPNVKSFEQILEEVSQMQHEVEGETSSMYERSGTKGFIASLLGGIAGSFTTRDPLNIVTAPIGAGRTVVMRIATDMGVAAAVAGTTELFDVAPAREIAGLPERDPLFNIAAATIGAGVIRGGIEGIGYGVGRLRGGREEIDFDLRDEQLRQMFEANADKPSARAGASILDDVTFIERNNPYGEGHQANIRFLAELQSVQRAMNGEPMTALARVMPMVPYDYIRKAADFEIVREQAPQVYAKMEAAQARLVEGPTFYHATTKQFDRFDDSHFGTGSGSGDRAHFFYNTREGAEGFLPRVFDDPLADEGRLAPGANIKEVKLAVENTKTVDMEGEPLQSLQRYIDEAKKEGFDSIRFKNYDDLTHDLERTVVPDVIAVFEGNKVISARTTTQKRAARKEYEAAYREVEAEAARIREQQTRAEAAQQHEAVNILASEGLPFTGPLLRHDNVASLVDRINAFNDTLDERTAAKFVRETLGEGENKVEVEVWEKDGGIDIGLKDPVDPNFRFVTDDGEMTVAQAMRDLQEDADLVEAIKGCAI